MRLRSTSCQWHRKITAYRTMNRTMDSGILSGLSHGMWLCGGLLFIIWKSM